MSFNINNSFPCYACGQCCRYVDKSTQTAYLSRGDGVCRHLDEQSNLCMIYEHRPLVCQVEKYYQVYLKEHLSWQDFVERNVQICQKLQQASY